MKYIYLVNRFKLQKGTEEIIARIHRASQARGMDYEIRVSETAADAARAIEGLEGSRCVVTTIGGDGSINLLLQKLVGTDHILSFIPNGTGNDFYRTCAQTLEDGIHETDIVRINDRYFINAACFGIDADIANDETFIHNKLIPRSMRFNMGVLYHFLTFRGGRALRITCEGETIEKRFTTVVAANAGYYGGGYRISPGSRTDDGVMEVYLIDSLRKVSMARVILSMKHAGHLKHPALQMYRTQKLVITARQPIIANIDGEPLEGDRFELELIPKGIRLAFDRKLIGEIAPAFQSV